MRHQLRPCSSWNVDALSLPWGREVTTVLVSSLLHRVYYMQSMSFCSRPLCPLVLTFFFSLLFRKFPGVLQGFNISYLKLNIHHHLFLEISLSYWFWITSWRFKMFLWHKGGYITNIIGVNMYLEGN